MRPKIRAVYGLIRGSRVRESHGAGLAGMGRGGNREGPWLLGSMWQVCNASASLARNWKPSEVTWKWTSPSLPGAFRWWGWPIPPAGKCRERVRAALRNAGFPGAP